MGHPHERKAKPVADFPHPNPYFPMPPRRRRAIHPLLSFMMFLFSGPGVVLLFKRLEWLGDWTVLAAGVLLVVFVVGMFSFFTSIERLPWRYGKIVPVLVTARAVAPEREDAVGCLAAMLIPGFIGALLALAKIVRRDRNPNRLIVTWVRGGKLHVAQPVAGDHFAKWQEGDVAWVCLLPLGQTVLVDHMCPSDFQVPIPPENVVASLKEEVARLQSMTMEQRRTHRREWLELHRHARLSAQSTETGASGKSSYVKRPSEPE